MKSGRPVAAGDRVLRAIWEEGTHRSQLEPLAQALLDSIGPRLTASPGMMAAQDWLGSYRDFEVLEQVLNNLELGPEVRRKIMAGRVTDVASRSALRAVASSTVMPSTSAMFLSRYLISSVFAL